MHHRPRSPLGPEVAGGDAEAVEGQVRVDEFVPRMDVSQMNYTSNFYWKILAATR